MEKLISSLKVWEEGIKFWDFHIFIFFSSPYFIQK